MSPVCTIQNKIRRSSYLWRTSCGGFQSFQVLCKSYPTHAAGLLHSFIRHKGTSPVGDAYGQNGLEQGAFGHILLVQNMAVLVAVRQQRALVIRNEDLQVLVAQSGLLGKVGNEVLNPLTRDC